MTSQFDFSNAEWTDVATLPVLVGYAVAMAEDSGRVGSYLEVRTLAHSITSRAAQGPARTLIEAVSTTDVKDKVEEFEEHSPELLADIAVQAAVSIGEVLDLRATPAESQAFKQWVLDVGQEVAEAAKEHGVRVSEREVQLLDRLRVAMDLD